MAVLLAAGGMVPPAFADLPLLTKHASDPATDAKVRVLLEQSRRAFDKGELLVAITRAKTAVYLDPINAAARLQLGICLMQSGDAYNAEDQLRRARFDGASDTQVLSHLFEAMLTRGEFDQLLEEFPDPGTPPEGPNAAQVLRARAIAFQGVGKAQDANASMDRSLALLRDRKGIIIRANIALEQDDTKLAKNLSDEVLAANPRDAESLDLRVRTALAMGDVKLALQTANDLVNVNPRSLNSRLTRIGVYLAANMDDKAKREVDLVRKQFSNLAVGAYYQALLLARAGKADDAWKIGMVLPDEFNKSSPEVADNVAQMAARAGHLEPAAAILHAAMARWPHVLELRLDLAEIRLKQKAPADALATLQPFEATNDPVVATLLARTYIALHRPQDARKYLEIVRARGGAAVNMKMGARQASELLADWLDVEPTDINARRQYAQLLVQLGNTQIAIEQYQRVVQTAPDDATSLNNLAWLVQKSDPKRALDLARKAVKLEPGSASALDTEGWLAFGQKDVVGAHDTLERAHELDPRDAMVSYHLAEVLTAMGNSAEAKKLLKGLLADGSVQFDGRADAQKLLASLH